MKIVKMMCAVAMFTATAGAPVLAQDAMKGDAMKGDAMKSGAMMASDSHMKMTAAQTRMMGRCKKMSHAVMMKHKGCMKMMKMHSGMMKAH